jgi:hypothetical protein
MQSQLFRSICRLLIVTMTALSLPFQGARAALLDTESAIGIDQAQQNRVRVIALLNRADVQAELQKRGINPADAKARVAALTDEEVAKLNGKLDQLPAGGVSVLGVLLVVFIVLLITDALGWTKVFPWQINPR